jgi:predicted phage terminase large subunit-like protein
MGLIRRKLTKRTSELQFERAAQEQLDRLATLTMFADTGASDRDERLRRCKEDPFFFAHTYLPHYFTAPHQAEWHEALVNAVRQRDLPVVITAHRDGAKSTIVSFAEVLRAICLEEEEFIVLVMDSLDKSEMYTQRVLIELQHNERIRSDFGRLVGKADARKNFITRKTNGRTIATRLVAWGDGMSMRGLVSQHSRPSWIIVEDIQDRAKAENPKITKKQWELLLGDYFPAKRAKNWRFTVIGNIICNGSLIDLLFKKANNFDKKIFAAIMYDEHGTPRSSWPEQYSLAELEKIKETVGLLIFMAEYMCEPQEVDGAFDRNLMKHWKDLPSWLPWRELFLTCDPSYSDIGDCKALYAMMKFAYKLENPHYGEWRDAQGKPFVEGLYHIIVEAYCRQSSIDNLIEQLYSWFDKFRPKVIYMDGTFGQSTVFGRELRRWATKKGRNLPVKPVYLQEKKENRILALQSDVNNGFILFPPNSNDDVETTITQFSRFGKPKVNDDGPDAIAIGVEQSARKENRGGGMHITKC